MMFYVNIGASFVAFGAVMGLIVILIGYVIRFSFHAMGGE